MEKKKSEKRNTLATSRASEYIQGIFHNKKRANELRQTGDLLPLRSACIYYKTLPDGGEEVCNAEEYGSDTFQIVVKTEGNVRSYVIKSNNERLKLDENELELISSRMEYDKSEPRSVLIGALEFATQYARGIKERADFFFNEEAFQ